MNINKRIRRILAFSITSLVLILLMAVPIAASGIPESSGILESLGIMESSAVQESFGNPESSAVQESSGNPESSAVQESSGESESPTVQESLDYLETSADPEISVDPGSSEKLEVHFINVGQGDATLISCDGHHMLIDGGNKDDYDRILTYLQDHGVTRLDYIVATHGHADHVGGLSGALDAVSNNVGTVLAPYTTCDGSDFRKFANRLSKIDKPIIVPRRGNQYRLGYGTFTIISAGGSEPNESIMLRFAYGNSSFLFTGDAPKEEERAAVLSYGDDLQSTVLKVPHHGSYDSSTYIFLRAVQPSIAVISSGSNGYGHPSEEALSRLRDVGAIVIRTDNNGDIVMTSYGDAVHYSADRKISQYDNLIPGDSTHSLYKDRETESEGDGNVSTWVIDVTTESDDKEKGEPEGGVADESVSGSEGESGSRSSGESVSGSAGESASGSEGESGTSEKKFKYILNESTKKFHNLDCSYIGDRNAPNKREVTATKKKVLADGYEPCKHCKP